MLRIGLTGGIGSGKSTVAALFAARGVAVIDTDVLARELVEPGQPAWQAICTRFEAVLPGLLRPDGQLDRALLRAHVFAQPTERQALEAILHPRIRAEVTRRVAQLQASYVLIVIPLLFEAGQADLVDRVLVVDVPEAVQRARVLARDRLAESELAAILAAQLTRAQRLARADDVIDNAGDPAALPAQVDTLHRRYLALAN